MDIVMWWLVQITLTLVLSASAGYAAACWRVDSGSVRLRKSLSEATLDIERLVSEQSKLMDLVRKLSQRQALSDHRHKRSATTSTPDGPPPPGTSKEQLRMFYFGGKNQREIAALHAGRSEDDGE